MARGERADEALARGRRIRRSEEPFRQFWQQVKRAERESEAIVVGNLMKAIPHTPTAAIAWLERRFGERWSRSEGRELSGQRGGPIQVESAAVVESPAERILRDTTRLRRRLLGIPDDWTDAEVDTLDAEANTFVKAQVAARVSHPRRL